MIPFPQENTETKWGVVAPEPTELQTHLFHTWLTTTDEAQLLAEA